MQVKTASDFWVELQAAANKVRAVLAAHPEWEATVTTTSSGSTIACLPEHRAAALAALGMVDEPTCQHCAQPHLSDVECPAPSTRMDSPGMMGVSP